MDASIRKQRKRQTSNWKLLRSMIDAMKSLANSYNISYWNPNSKPSWGPEDILRSWTIDHFEIEIFGMFLSFNFFRSICSGLFRLTKHFLWWFLFDFLFGLLWIGYTFSCSIVRFFLSKCFLSFHLHFSIANELFWTKLWLLGDLINYLVYFWYCADGNTSLV